MDTPAILNISSMLCPRGLLTSNFHQPFRNNKLLSTIIYYCHCIWLLAPWPHLIAILLWHHYKLPYWLYQGLLWLPHQNLTWLQITLLTLIFYCGSDETASLIAILSAQPSSSRTLWHGQLLSHDKSHLGYIRVSSNTSILDQSEDRMVSQHNGLCSALSYITE